MTVTIPKTDAEFMRRFGGKLEDWAKTTVYKAVAAETPIEVVDPTGNLDAIAKSHGMTTEQWVRGVLLKEVEDVRKKAKEPPSIQASVG